MRDIILSKLNEMEKENNIKILYAVESGSRGWGFASKDSDYDARFIYIRPIDWYLSIDEKKDYLEYPIDELLDINGWDLKKALQLYKKSNPPLLEWLSSPIVYMENYSLAQKMRDLLPDFFSAVPTIYHYLHIARNKYQEIMSTDQVKIKRYFYILRPLLACMWIEKNNTMPPMEFVKLMTDQVLDGALINEIEKLLNKKTSGLEIDIEPKSPLLIEFLRSKISYYENHLKSVKKTNVSDYSILNTLFQETLKEVW
ncbi:nucleotidyltransferase domain-containing protein [Pseudobacteroides cellulosolvens]|uniref:Nucleotidyltransferase n=1 Tax=Pseudobacteroides cellulosolvens ATCC 35603 = DSM 2933 TaxID=398512 RepID=A0A0L6JHH8_9FIRM|nr:nucleotidyltransferase domain-containing protein [Pseudobacteroides cellulosolvens]KNY25179.1 Nucleotidyltransferase [Pseudobacteroides cellulosolvens ATCC 35603 = DSM 2933]